MGASARARSYAISIFENSYAFGEDPPPSQAQLDAEQRAWQTRLGNIMNATDAWLAEETRQGHLAPLEITIDTAPVEVPAPTQRAAALKRPALIAMPRCVLGERNLIVEVRVALKNIPAPAARTALSSSLCARIKAAEASPRAPQPLESVAPVRGDRDGLALSLDGNFSVPKALLPAVNRTRADFFKKAADAMVQSSHRFEKEHPGVTLRRVSGAGSHAVRFFMDGPLGGFDLLTDVAVAAGAKRPTEVEVKDAFYDDWQRAGLPLQVGLYLLVQESH